MVILLISDLECHSDLECQNLWTSILNYSNNSTQFHLRYLSRKARHLGGNALTQNKALFIFGWELYFFLGGGESHHKIPLTIYSCMKHHEYCWWCFFEYVLGEASQTAQFTCIQHITWKLTDMKGTRLSSDLNWLYFIAQLTEHWTSKPKVVGSIPIIVKQNFCLASLDIYSEKHHQQYILYTLPEYRYITSTTYYTMNTLMFTKEHPGVLV